MAKFLLVGFLLVLGLGAVWMIGRKAPQEPVSSGNSSAAQSPTLRQTPPTVVPPLVEVPAAPRAAADATGSTRTAQPGVAQLPLEVVEPLLELNLIQAGNGIEGESEEPVKGSIDDLLGTKHYRKSHDQLDLSLRSVEAVLALQATPSLIPKEQVLSEQALSALRIEAAWLKERVYK